MKVLEKLKLIGSGACVTLAIGFTSFFFYCKICEHLDERERRIRFERRYAEHEAKINAAKVKPEDMIQAKFDKPVSLEIDPKTIEKVYKVSKEDYKTVIKELKTPLEAAIYCIYVIEGREDADWRLYGRYEYFASFKYIHDIKADDCDGGSVAAAAILSDNGFPPYIGILEQDEGDGHAIFVYKKDGLYGSIGINISDYRFGYANVEDLKDAIGKTLEQEFDTIEIYDLGKRFPDFIDNDKDNNPNPLFF